MYDTNNIFAKILRKEIPCNEIYEDNMVLLFHDINPQAKIHILGIPKFEAIDLSDFITKADKTMINYFFSKIVDVSREFNLVKNGYKVISNSGKNGGQDVLHFHVHILGGENLRK